MRKIDMLNVRFKEALNIFHRLYSSAIFCIPNDLAFLFKELELFGRIVGHTDSDNTANSGDTQEFFRSLPWIPTIGQYPTEKHYIPVVVRISHLVHVPQINPIGVRDHIHSTYLPGITSIGA